MNLSGILVVANPARQGQVVESLRAMQGVEVHQVDAETGRIVAVQEAEDINAEVAGLRAIKAVPHVIMAEMVYHYVGEDERTYEMPAELEHSEDEFNACGSTPDEASQCAVPAYLNS